MLEERLLLLSERIRRLVNDNARTEMEPEEYHREYDVLSVEYRQRTESRRLTKRYAVGKRGRSRLHCSCGCLKSRKRMWSLILGCL